MKFVKKELSSKFFWNYFLSFPINIQKFAFARKQIKKKRKRKEDGWEDIACMHTIMKHALKMDKYEGTALQIR